MFPHLEDSFDSSMPLQCPVPGTSTRMKDAMTPQEGGQGVPSHWDSSSPPPQANPAGWGQPTTWNGQVQQPEAYAAQFSQQNPQSLATNPGSMTSGAPDMPGTLDPNSQSWPAFTREQYDPRQPAANPQPPDNFGGQSLPQYNPAPQNYGRSW
jgi:hypothetical protein